MFAKNRVPRENGQLSRHEKFYGYAPSYKRMIPFGALGFIEDKTDKESLTRAKCGKMQLGDKKFDPPLEFVLNSIPVAR